MTCTPSSLSAQSRRDVLNILLLGEGNLTFAYALTRKLSKSRHIARLPSSRAHTSSHTPPRDHVPNGNSSSVDCAAGCATPSPLPERLPTCRIFATTFDGKDALIRRYPEAVRILSYFAAKTRIRVRYLDHVNAVCFNQGEAWQAVMGETDTCPPHLIYFNNPHMGYEDQYRHRSLLSHFFAGIARMRRHGQHGYACPHPTPPQVVVTLCDDQPRRWNLLGAAARSGFLCLAAVPLTPQHFPGYENKRHQSDATFHYACMISYYFVHTCDLSVAELRRLRRVLCDTALSADALGRRAVNGAEWLRTYDSLTGGFAAVLNEEERVVDGPTVETVRAQHPSASVGVSGDTQSSLSSCPSQQTRTTTRVRRHVTCPSEGDVLHTHYLSDAWCPCIPLLHPDVAFYSSYAHSVDRTHEALGELWCRPPPSHVRDAYFYPYLEPSRICACYEWQARMRPCTCAPLSRVAQNEEGHDIAVTIGVDEHDGDSHIRRTCTNRTEAVFFSPPRVGAGETEAVMGGRAEGDAVPPALNAQRLGRPLTDRERAKLQRFHSRQQTRPCRKKIQKATPPLWSTSAPDSACEDAIIGTAVQSAAHTAAVCESAVARCFTCQPVRVFASAADVEQHVRACHGSSAVPHPNMHARAHQHLVSKDRLPCVCHHDPNDHEASPCRGACGAATRVGEGAFYCRVCDLTFVNRATFDEHLDCLSPDVHLERHLRCGDCDPPRYFVDTRALAQHKAQKHARDVAHVDVSDVAQMKLG